MNRNIRAGLIAAIMAISFIPVTGQVSVGITFGTPPPWGPPGYTEVRYYYLPDVEAYYDVQDEVFIYHNTGRWVRVRSLPGRYRNYDLYTGPKVVINGYYGPSPYAYYYTHRSHYPRGYHGRDIVYYHKGKRGHEAPRGSMYRGGPGGGGGRDAGGGGGKHGQGGGKGGGKHVRP